MNINTGLPADARRSIADGLNQVLAESYVLYQKTHAFHWNVEGPMFQTLHTLFETQYTELWQSLDVIAERIRALGFPAPGTYSEYSALSSIAETPGVPAAREMIALLLAGHEAVAATSRKVLPRAQEVGDEVTVGLLTDRLNVHEKTAWMLRSMLAG